jgi:hypothetical protein
METRAIDMLFLELSQFTQATTAREFELKYEVSRLANEVAEFRAAFNKETFRHAETGRELARIRKSLSEFRECHKTFDGGYKTAEEREVFHHGMETMCNVADAVIGKRAETEGK